MPLGGYGGERLRRDLEKRARKAEPRGQVVDRRFPIRPAGTEDLTPRHNGRFEDQTGLEIDGFMSTSGMLTGPGG